MLSSVANCLPLAANGAVRTEDELGKIEIPKLQLPRPDVGHCTVGCHDLLLLLESWDGEALRCRRKRRIRAVNKRRRLLGVDRAASASPAVGWLQRTCHAARDCNQGLVPSGNDGISRASDISLPSATRFDEDTSRRCKVISTMRRP